VAGVSATGLSTTLADRLGRQAKSRRCGNELGVGADFYRNAVMAISGERLGLRIGVIWEVAGFGRRHLADGGGRVTADEREGYCR
jgi:hypothetical protein